MARFESSGLDDLISEMQRMGQQTGPVAAEMVQAAVDIIKEKWKESCSRPLESCWRDSSFDWQHH